MRTLLELRRDCGNCVETRALHCPDGLIRIVVMHPAHWRELDTILAHSDLTLSSIMTDYVLPFSGEATEDQHCFFDDAFRENLMYYIHRSHQNYLQWHHQIANEDWDNRNLIDDASDSE